VTPLALAVEAGNLEIVTALIAAGADVNHALLDGYQVISRGLIWQLVK
jgi:ankyrin repeat protein